jgi:dihydroxyacetone kinase
MTRLWNDPADFADDMTAGFVRANGRWVRRVHGGVSRSTRSAEPEVAVVIGGGSGHYPAFGGLVGRGAEDVVRHDDSSRRPPRTRWSR